METSKSTPSKDLQIFMNYRRLRNIKRCNNFPVNNREDVAQHSYYVTLLAMAIATEYNHWAGTQNMRYHIWDADHHLDLVNTDLIVLRALSHDLEEAFTSDIPWNVKHYSEQSHEVIEGVIQDKLDKVYEGSSLLIQRFNDWNSTCKDGLEGQFVDIADMLELSVYCWEELALGNTAMESLLVKSLGLLKDHTLYDNLVQASPLFKGLIDLLQDPDVLGSMNDVLNID